VAGLLAACSLAGECSRLVGSVSSSQCHPCLEISFVQKRSYAPALYFFVCRVLACIVRMLCLAGCMPKWLKGSLIRNGPGNLKVGDMTFRHLFDGSALLHRLETVRPFFVACLDHNRGCTNFPKIWEPPSYIGARRMT
jgi:hypothetical protein